MKTCELCPERAVWQWTAIVSEPFYLCDRHAADKDLNDLEEL